MSGCAICVYDLYEESLEAYKKAVADLRMKLTSMNISEDQWPNNIQSHKKSGPNTQAVDPASVVRSAFEEMERILKERCARMMNAQLVNQRPKRSSRADQACQCSV